MKKFFTTLAITFYALAAHAQSVGINTAPAASAALDVASQSKGILVPRMSTTARNAIISPQKGLMVFDSLANNFYYFNGTAWTAVGGSGSGTKLELLVTKTTNAQVLSNANGSNTGDVVTFDNVAVTPTLGSYSASSNTYTVGAGQGGLYMVEARTRAVDNSTPNNTVNQYLFVQVNGGGVGDIANAYPQYIGSSPSNLPSGLKGLGAITTLLYLNAGDQITIRGLASNSTVVGTALKTDGSCKFFVVKMN